MNNESVGGINKSKKNELFSPTMCLAEHAKAYKLAETDAKSENFSVRERGKKLKESLQNEAFLTEGVVRKNLGALWQNLGLLKKFSESSKSKNKVEKMLNLIQQCCLNAWVFNDVAKILETIGYSKESLENLGILSKENKEMRKLNDAARETMMFKEFKINDLIKDAKLAIDGSFNGGKVRNFLKEWGEEKIGFRGRHGVDKNDERVSSKPIGNTKEGKDVIQGSLFKDEKFKSGAGNTVAIKGSIVPDETANLKTVPDKMLEDLGHILNTTVGQEIVKLLKEKGLIEDVGGALQAKPSFASFINDAGLPTYCSVSGTTGEIVSVLHCTLKNEDRSSPLTGVFENLLKIADGIWPDPPFNFSTYFAPVATFMEVGHFHTTGEVLGGFLSVAVADRNVNSEVGIRLSGGDEEKIKQTKEDASEFRFKNLLNYFNCHQELFLAPVGEEPAQVWTTVAPGNAMWA